MAGVYLRPSELEAQLNGAARRTAPCEQLDMDAFATWLTHTNQTMEQDMNMTLPLNWDQPSMCSAAAQYQWAKLRREAEAANGWPDDKQTPWPTFTPDAPPAPRRLIRTELIRPDTDVLLLPWPVLVAANPMQLTKEQRDLVMRRTLDEMTEDIVKDDYAYNPLKSSILSVLYRMIVNGADATRVAQSAAEAQWIRDKLAWLRQVSNMVKLAFAARPKDDDALPVVRKPPRGRGRGRGRDSGGGRGRGRGRGRGQRAAEADTSAAETAASVDPDGALAIPIEERLQAWQRMRTLMAQNPWVLWTRKESAAIAALYFFAECDEDWPLPDDWTAEQMQQFEANWHDPAFQERWKLITQWGDLRWRTGTRDALNQQLPPELRQTKARQAAPRRRVVTPAQIETQKVKTELREQRKRREAQRKSITGFLSSSAAADWLNPGVLQEWMNDNPDRTTWPQWLQDKYPSGGA